MNRNQGQDFIESLGRVREDLPFSPSLMKDLLSLTGQDSQASLHSIADVINRNQSLTAKTLAVANSAFYGLESEVSSVSRALAVLGLKTIRSVVLTLTVKSLQSKLKPGLLDMDAYWKHHIRTAIIARELAFMTKGMDPEDLFTAGMLHDMGKLITALYRPDDWRAIRDLARENSLTDSQAENQYWGLEHGLIAGVVLDSWRLPPVLTQPVNWHHSPSLAPEFQRQAMVLALANLFDHRLADPECRGAEQVAPWCRGLGLDEEDVEFQLELSLDEESVNSYLAGLAETTA